MSVVQSTSSRFRLIFALNGERGGAISAPDRPWFVRFDLFRREEVSCIFYRVACRHAFIPALQPVRARAWNATRMPGSGGDGGRETISEGVWCA